MARALVLVVLALGFSACNCGDSRLTPVCAEEVCGAVEAEPETVADSGIVEVPDSGTVVVVVPDAGAAVPDSGAVVPPARCSDGGWCREGQAPDGGYLTWRNLNAVFARTADEAYAVGDYGTLLKWDGVNWTRAAVGGPADDLFTVFAVDPQNVLVGGIVGDPADDEGMYARYNGSQFDWIWKPLSRRPQGMVGWAANDVWAVGYGGEVRHFIGNYWMPSWGVTTESINDVADLGGTLWAVGSNGLLVRRDSLSGAWTTAVAPPASPAVGELKAIVAVGSGAIAAGGDEWLEFDGVSWTHRRLAGVQINSVWAVSMQKAWAVGNGGKAWRIEGALVTELVTGVTVDLKDVHGVDEDHVWAVGNGGVILRLE